MIFKSSFLNRQTSHGDTVQISHEYQLILKTDTQMEVEAKMLEADEHERDKRSVFGFTTYGNKISVTDVSHELLSNINV